MIYPVDPMAWDKSLWPALSPLLDGALDLEGDARRDFLASLALESPTLAHALEDLLAQHVRAVHAQFLDVPVATSGEAAPSLAGETIGGYTLERPLGAGGMGTVWLARRTDGRFEGSVAIKLLNLALVDREGQSRFRREGTILASLSHPSIARLLDAGVSALGQPYLVLEFVDGVRLDRYADRERLDLEARLQLFLQIADAVAHAHTHFVVHRDLKPSNILVTADGQAKLLDFGIATLRSESSSQDSRTATTLANRALTPQYAAPEQVTGRGVTMATDVYALGVMLYQLLVGVHPTAEPDTPDSTMLLALENREPRRPSDVVAHLDESDPATRDLLEQRGTTKERLRRACRGDLDAIVLQALKKRPDQRYATVQALAADIRRHLAHQPISARPDTLAYRLRRFARRNRVAVAATLVLLSGLSIGLYIVNRQRAVAEMRFQLVRQIANELFNVEQDISTLPGSTAARERIVKTSLDYLERLRSEAGGDLGLKAEIATGYRKVAEVQGVPRRTNLGHLDQALVSLGKADALLRELRERRFDRTGTLRELIQTVDFESRIDYGLRDLPALTARIARLEALVTEYEMANERDDALISEVFDSMSASVQELGRLDDAATYARRAIDARREVVRRDPSIQARGALANSLTTYARVARGAGRLDDAERALTEALALLEQLTTEEPLNYRWQVNLANTSIALGRVLGDAGGPSLGRLDDAIAAFERGLVIGRRVIAADPKEIAARYNHALGSWRLGDVIRVRDPAGALALYDEAIAVLRGSPGGNFNRDAPLVNVLAESTLPLRQLHRDREARERLDEATRLAAPYRKTPSQTSLLVDDPISRAEADWALASQRPDQAASWHQAFANTLESLETAGFDPRNDLTNAFVLSRRYRLLAEALTAAGRAGDAAAIDIKRRELVQFWKEKLPASPFVEPALMR